MSTNSYATLTTEQTYAKKNWEVLKTNQQNLFLWIINQQILFRIKLDLRQIIEQILLLSLNFFVIFVFT